MSTGLTRVPTQARRNLVAIEMRTKKGWSQRRLAKEFQDIGARLELPVSEDISAVVKQISRVERGSTETPDAMYLRLWCEAFQVEASELFGHLDAPVVSADSRATYAVISHKFIPAYLGCASAQKLQDQATPATGQWVDCWQASLPHPAGSASVYVWPFGVGVVHLVEELELPSLGELAAWRAQSYPVARSWADKQLQALIGTCVETEYVLSTYWLSRAKWTGVQLDTAVRLLAMPSMLLDRNQSFDTVETVCAAEQVERQLLRDNNVERADLLPFGARGVSIAYASWSGVAYHPVSARRSLDMTELVSCELLTQAIWCYTYEIQRQVEAGRDPVVPAEYSWRFLRAIRSRLTAPRPLESGQHNSMRDAVLLTSQLSPKLDAAIDALRESEAGG